MSGVTIFFLYIVTLIFTPVLPILLYEYVANIHLAIPDFVFFSLIIGNFVIIKVGSLIVFNLKHTFFSGTYFVMSQSKSINELSGFLYAAFIFVSNYLYIFLLILSIFRGRNKSAKTWDKYIEACLKA